MHTILFLPMFAPRSPCCVIAGEAIRWDKMLYPISLKLQISSMQLELYSARGGWISLRSGVHVVLRARRSQRAWVEKEHLVTLSSFLMTLAMTQHFCIPLCHGNLPIWWPDFLSPQCLARESSVHGGKSIKSLNCFSWTLPQCWQNQSDWCNYTIMVAWLVLTWMRTTTDLQARCPL